MNFDFSCTKNWIEMDSPYQLWEMQTSDGHVNPLLVRFFHNKLFTYLDNYFLCYWSYLSPDYVQKAFSIVGMVLFYAGVYFGVRRRNYFVLLLAAFSPIFPLLELGSDNFRWYGYFVCIVFVMIYAVYVSFFELRRKVKNG